MVSIIGDGCVGKGLAYLFERQQVGVTLIGRSGAISPVQAVNFGSEVHENVWLGASGARDAGRSDVVLVAVKAYSLLDACVQHLDGFNPCSTVICLSNGYVLPEVNRIAELFPRMNVRAGVIRIGFKETAGCLEISSTKGGIHWGAITGSAKPTSKEKTLLNLPFCHWSDSPITLIREKWLQNTVINHLSVFYSLERNRDLLTKMEVVKEVYEEVYRLGIELWESWEFDEKGGFNDLIDLIEMTADNENSMRRDARLGKPTESAFLAGLATRREGYPWLQRLASFNENNNTAIRK